MSFPRMYHLPVFPQPRMTPEQKEVCVRILHQDYPPRVSRAERNILNLQPPPDEEDRLCREKVGLDLEELKAKVMASPDTLSQAETDIIILGAQYDRQTETGRVSAFWTNDLPPEEKQFIQQARNLIADDHEMEVWKKAHFRSRVFTEERRAMLEATRPQRVREKRAAMEASTIASMPYWAREIAKSKPWQWGFVVFRTAYGHDTQQGFRMFKKFFEKTCRDHLKSQWHEVALLLRKHKSVWVDDESLNSADVGTLRARFKAMREQNEIPHQLATDCFLVADDRVLQESCTKPFTLQVKPFTNSDYWQDELVVKAVDPDFDETRDTPQGFQGEITVPLPKVFDWLYYTGFAKSEDWETRFKVTQQGSPELLDPKTPYPAYRASTEPPQLIAEGISEDK
ncbi:hypothetical protein AB5N19_13031 [Seiridium cardinale]|uniref:Uncharacterized protein n=1 Tax=Seiridium cardinale TaxID=138064 RepID=A0ABR2XRI7_9PEZI